MAVTRSTPEDREHLRERLAHLAAPRSRSAEGFFLGAVSAVIVLGLCLVYRAKVAGFRDPQQAPGARILNLKTLSSPDALLPYLGFLSDPDDRLLASKSIFDFVRDRGIEGIADLRAVRIPAGRIEASHGLDYFASRLRDLRKITGTAAPAVPVFDAAQLRQIRPFLVVRTQGKFGRTVLLHSLLFFASFYAVHLAWRAVAFQGDMLLLPLIHFLAGIGSILMISLRDPLRDALLFPDFIYGVAAAAGALFFFSRPDYDRTGLRRLSYIPLLAGVALSIVLLVFGSGPGASEAKINVNLGAISFQPVELIKILLLFFLAGYFADRWDLLRELREPRGRLPGALQGWNVPRLRHALPVAAGVAIAIVFFFLQKDLGPALVFTSVFLTLYAVARGRVLGALAGCAAIAAAFWIGYLIRFPATVAGRVAMWLSPWDNFVRPGGDHLAQSFWTFAAGAVFGTGLGMGEPQSVPAIHTDLVLAAIAEELGFAGLLAVFVVYALLIHRALKISLRARGHYTFFLGLGLTLLIAFQVALISGGILGLVPLSGVVTPFLNYGKSSTIVNFAIVGILAAVSARQGAPEREGSFRMPLRWVAGLLAAIGAVVMLQAARVQLLQADEILVKGALVVQGDGHRRFAYNPRVVEAAERIPRGSIFDRNGIPLATSSRALLEHHRPGYQRLGVALDKSVEASDRRHYPFGPVMFHLLGDLRSRINWGASNTAFAERDYNARLQGFDDRATVVRVADTPGGSLRPVLKHDYRELVPLVRYRYRPGHEDVQRILSRSRDLRLTIDARLQKQASEIMERHIRAAGQQKGAAIVIDAVSGELLASVSYPMPEAPETAEKVDHEGLIDATEGKREQLLDRPRFGLYPPGSSFKLVTAMAALQRRGGAENQVFQCRLLPDGRVGNVVRGWSRPVRDDVLDKAPHGSIDMAQGISQSCNAYFAQLGAYVVGAEALLRQAEAFGIRVADPNSPAKLADALPQAAYGQGQVVASPLAMACVAATVSNDGALPKVHCLQAEEDPPAQRVLPQEHAKLLARYMREVVTAGTGRSLKNLEIPIAGKTGTAELAGKPSHAWFVGFAPYGGEARRRIAFAIMIENGRYGGRVAAPAAGEIVTAAARLGVIRSGNNLEMTSEK